MTQSLGFGLSDKVYVPDRKHAVTPGGVPATAEGAGKYESLRRGENTESYLAEKPLGVGRARSRRGEHFRLEDAWQAERCPAERSRS